MKIANITFTKQGFSTFKGLKKQEQKEFIKSKSPLLIDKEIDRLLKDVPYAKPKRNSRKNKASKEEKQSE